MQYQRDCNFTAKIFTKAPVPIGRREADQFRFQNKNISETMTTRRKSIVPQESHSLKMCIGRERLNPLVLPMAQIGEIPSEKEAPARRPAIKAELIITANFQGGRPFSFYLLTESIINPSV